MSLSKKLHLEYFDIAGNSMGGVIAALYTQKYSSNIKKHCFRRWIYGCCGLEPAN